MDRTGQQIGNYRLAGLLGSGGFADVYLGKNIYMGYEVAIKVLKNATLSASFIAEAKLISKLKHPNIVQLLDFGRETSGEYYLVMEYVSGGTLRSIHPKGTRVPMAKVANYVEQITEALQYAHNNNLIHRDLKPENILIDQNGRILLSDFGIATIRKTTMELQQHMVTYSGTPAYSAPEQIRGQPRQESDQYSLGIMVYEWLTGELPFKGNPMSLMYHQTTTVPRPPSELNPDITVHLESYILMSLEKDYQNRYITVKDFAGVLYDAISHIYEHPLLTFSEDKSSLLMTMTWSPDSKHLASGDIKGNIYVWEALTGSIKRTYTQNSPVAYMAWLPDEKFLVCVDMSNTVNIWNTVTGNLHYKYSGGKADFPCADISPDGKWMAIRVEPNIVKVLHVLTGTEKYIYRDFGGTIYDLAWSPDGKFIACGGENSPTYQSIHIWNADTGQTTTTYKEHSKWSNYEAHTIAWSPNGKFIVSGNHHGIMRIWEPASNNCIREQLGIELSDVQYSPDGNTLIFLDHAGWIRMYNAIMGGDPEFRIRYDEVRNFAYSPDSKYVAVLKRQKVEILLAP